MLSIKIGNNAGYENYFMPEDYTIRQAFEEADVDYAGKTVIVDGTAVGAGGLNRTFRDLGYDGTPGRDKCILSAIAKVDNAR